MPKIIWNRTLERNLVEYVKLHKGEKTIRLICADFAHENKLDPDATYWKYYRISEPIGYTRKSSFRDSDSYKKILSYVQSNPTTK